MQNQFDPEYDAPPADPMVLLGEGMRPLPEDTDMDLLIACYDVISKTGATGFEVAFDDELPPETCWTARCWVGAQLHVVNKRDSAHAAAYALARRLINGARCTSCGRVTTLFSVPHTQGMPRAKGVLSAYCYWSREGKQFTRGCSDTHEEFAATRAALEER